MAQANRESTAPAPAAHPVPSDAELISRAWSIVAELEDDVRAVRDYGHILVAGLSVGAEEGYGGLGAALNRLGRDILDRYETIEEERGRLFHMLHSRRGEPDFPPYDDGNGEVEESAGEAGGDVELIALGERLTIAYAAEREAFARDCSYEEGDMLHKACSKIARQIEKVPATTLAGLRVKATAIDWCCAGKPFADADDTTDKRLVTSLLTDLHAMTAAAR